MNLNKIISIAKWEYLEKVKTKAFIISLIITPLLFISIAILPTLFFKEEIPTVELLGVVDTSGIYFSGLKEELERYKLEDGQNNYVLLNLANSKESIEALRTNADKDLFKNLIGGYLIIYDGGTDSMHAEYRTKAFGSFKNVSRLEEALNSVRLIKKLESEKIETNLISYIQSRIKIEQLKIDEPGKVSEFDFISTFILSIVFILLLLMMVVYSGQMLVRSMIEEKSSRLIEMLVSSSTPDEILTGKILGLGSLGITQIIIWLFIGFSLVGGAVIPASAFKNILPMLVYFILGFLFYTTLFVGIGSAVNTEQEAQHITTYLSLILMLPLIIVKFTIQNPDFIITKVFSYIPLTIPTVMLLRLNVQNVSDLDIIISLLIMVFSIFIVTKVSAKIFRIGILSYGNKPTLKEIFKWIKE